MKRKEKAQWKGGEGGKCRIVLWLQMITKMKKKALIQELLQIILNLKKWKLPKQIRRIKRLLTEMLLMTIPIL